ncbi:DUF7556 family protein [Halegenticoccus tardaugens]|uniref:DUF7556 family protein n=1 Tax=Halegenticoccus tardaugens TaxID=2071624 RepID=UPI00100A9A37|nr:hypothetical protein [Halegenticoccus tardaugens]
MTQSRTDTGKRGGNESVEIVFAVDEGDETASAKAIIADVARDDAWIAVPKGEAADLSRWR